MRLRTENGRTLWLAYGMNVHPGGDAASTQAAIDAVVLPLRDRLGVRGPFGVAVRWSADGVAGLQADSRRLAALRDTLRAHDLVPFTGNAFVHGTFHAQPVKAAVYRPPWSDPRRRAYTLAFAEVLAALNEPGATVSLSTAPRAWGRQPSSVEEELRAAEEIVACADGLRALEDRTGVGVRLALEPEPGCTEQTVGDVLALFGGPLEEALARRPGARPYLGICYDVCHQAVVHEPIEAGLDLLARQGIPVWKVQASCALEVADPTDPVARASLARFDEPVYLHQVGARDPDGLHVAADLPDVLGDAAGPWARRAPWRVHFHVPVFRPEALPPLTTTRDQLDEALRCVARGDLTDHVEIETYTWDVLPEDERRAGSGFDLVEALAREYAYVLASLRAHGTTPLDAVAP